MAFPTVTQITELNFSSLWVGRSQHDHLNRAQQVRFPGSLVRHWPFAHHREAHGGRAGPAAEGVLPRPLTLQEKTLARSLHRLAAWMCKTTPHDFRTAETALSKPHCKRLKTDNLIDPSDETERACRLRSMRGTETTRPRSTANRSPTSTHLQNRPTFAIDAGSCRGTGRSCLCKSLGQPHGKCGSRVGACAKPCCSCSVWTMRIQSHVSPLRLTHVRKVELIWHDLP